MAVTIYALREKVSFVAKLWLQHNPVFISIFILYFNKHGSEANLHRTLILLFRSLNHPIFSFYVFTVNIKACISHFLVENGRNTRSWLPSGPEISRRARLALLRSILRMVSGYPVAVFSGKMNRFTTNNFPWASTRLSRPVTPARTIRTMDNSSESGVTGCRISGANCDQVKRRRW